MHPVKFPVIFPVVLEFFKEVAALFMPSQINHPPPLFPSPTSLYTKRKENRRLTGYSLNGSSVRFKATIAPSGHAFSQARQPMQSPGLTMRACR